MNGKSISLWMLTLILAAVFCQAGVAKLAGAPQMVESFQRFGYTDSFRLLIGAGEVSAGALLLFPGTAAGAAWLLVCIMLGALGTLLTQHQYATALVPVGLGFLCLIVAFARRPANLHKPYAVSIRELDQLWERDRQFEKVRGGR